MQARLAPGPDVPPSPERGSRSAVLPCLACTAPHSSSTRSAAGPSSTAAPRRGPTGTPRAPPSAASPSPRRPSSSAIDRATGPRRTPCAAVSAPSPPPSTPPVSSARRGGPGCAGATRRSSTRSPRRIRLAPRVTGHYRSHGGLTLRPLVIWRRPDSIGGTFTNEPARPDSGALNSGPVARPPGRQPQGADDRPASLACGTPDRRTAAPQQAPACAPRLPSVRRRFS